MTTETAIASDGGELFETICYVVDLFYCDMMRFALWRNTGVSQDELLFMKLRVLRRAFLHFSRMLRADLFCLHCSYHLICRRKSFGLIFKSKRK